MTPYSGTDAFFALDIPLNYTTVGSPRTFSDFWVVSLPRFSFSYMGRTTALPIVGWAEVSVLDDAKAVIATFKLDIDGTDAKYTANNMLVCSKPADSEIPGYWDNRYCYKYASGLLEGNTNYDHALTFIGSSGKIMTSFSTPGNSSAGLGGTVTVDPGAGNWQRPAYLQLRVKNNKDGQNTGCGGVMLYQSSGNGGLIYGWE